MREKFDAARLRRIAQAATEQSKRAYVMQIREPLALDAFLGAYRPKGVFGQIGKPSSTARRGCSKTVLETRGEVDYIREETTVVIGPEGGFSEEETSSLLQARLFPMAFSNGILRVETAAIAGLAIVQHSFYLRK